MRPAEDGRNHAKSSCSNLKRIWRITHEGNVIQNPTCAMFFADLAANRWDTHPQNAAWGGVTRPMPHDAPAYAGCAIFRS